MVGYLTDLLHIPLRWRVPVDSFSKIGIARSPIKIKIKIILEQPVFRVLFDSAQIWRRLEDGYNYRQL